MRFINGNKLVLIVYLSILSNFSVYAYDWKAFVISTLALGADAFRCFPQRVVSIPSGQLPGDSIKFTPPPQFQSLRQPETILFSQRSNHFNFDEISHEGECPREKYDPLQGWEVANKKICPVAEKVYSALATYYPVSPIVIKRYRQHKKDQNFYAKIYYDKLPYHEKVARDQEIKNIVFEVIHNREMTLGGVAISALITALQVVPPNILKDSQFLKAINKISGDDNPRSIQPYVDFMITSYCLLRECDLD